MRLRHCGIGIKRGRGHPGLTDGRLAYLHRLDLGMFFVLCWWGWRRRWHSVGGGVVVVVVLVVGVRFRLVALAVALPVLGVVAVSLLSLHWPPVVENHLDRRMWSRDTNSVFAVAFQLSSFYFISFSSVFQQQQQ